nr:MAG TPA: hypothetical protein [Caudoviricetes sp.]
MVKSHILSTYSILSYSGILYYCKRYSYYKFTACQLDLINPYYKEYEYG